MKLTTTDTLRNTIEAEIVRRMSSGEPFTFAQLWAGNPPEAYRMADRKIQAWRKKGWIAYRREGRNVVWSLTDAGRAALQEKQK